MTKKVLFYFLILAMALGLCACGAPKKAETSLFAMDTYMTMTAYGKGAEDTLTEACRTINVLEQRLSRTREDSEIWCVNHGGGAVSAETAALIERSLTFAEETDGAFDITIAPLVEAWNITGENPRVPAQEEIDALLPLVGSAHVHPDGGTVTLDEGCAIDLGGIAKGYASDAVAELFARRGIQSGIVSLGGNVYVRGSHPEGRAWTVAVQDPLSDGYACLLALRDAFAVTSGGYQRYFTAPDGTVYQHIIDPHTGRPAQSDLLSATVVSHSGTRSDAYSTALYVMGEEAAVRFWAERGDFDMVLITDDGRILATPGLADCLTAREGAPYEIRFITR